MKAWSEAEVLQWVAAEGFGKYVAAFEQEEVFGATLANMTEELLCDDLVRVTGPNPDKKKASLNGNHVHAQTQRILRLPAQTLPATGLAAQAKMRSYAFLSVYSRSLAHTHRHAHVRTPARAFAPFPLVYDSHSDRE